MSYFQSISMTFFFLSISLYLPYLLMPLSCIFMTSQQVTFGPRIHSIFFRCLEGQSGLNHASKLELSWFAYIKLSSNLINIIVHYNTRSRLYNDGIIISYANNSTEKNRIEIKDLKTHDFVKEENGNFDLHLLKHSINQTPLESSHIGFKNFSLSKLTWMQCILHFLM